LSPLNGVEAVYKELEWTLRLGVNLFDYEDNLVTDSALEVSIENNKMINVDVNKVPSLKNNVITIPHTSYGILKCIVQKSIVYNGTTSKIIDLSTEIPIPVSYSKDENVLYFIFGPTYVIYNDFGKLENEEFYNDKYKLYSINVTSREVQEVKGVSWKMAFYHPGGWEVGQTTNFLESGDRYN
jgi:hypothetical protein